MGLPLPSTLTPSKLGKFTSCPLAFRFSYIERLPEPPTSAQLRGTIVHRVLQLLFGEGDASTRTPERATAHLELAFAEVTASGELDALELSETGQASFRREVATLVGRYFSIEDPRQVTPVGIELDLRVEVDGVEYRGIINRLNRMPDGRFVVVDYKTGRSPRADRSASRLLGIRFYAFLCEVALGIRPSETRLLYFGDQVVIVETPTDQSLRGLHQRASAIWAAIERSCAAEDFRPNPTTLCKYCAFQDRCPAFGDTSPLSELVETH